MCLATDINGKGKNGIAIIIVFIVLLATVVNAQDESRVATTDKSACGKKEAVIRSSPGIPVKKITKIGSEVWMYQGQYLEKNNLVKYVAVIFDPLKYHISITNVVSEIHKDRRFPYPRYSIKELLETGNSFLIINGGMFTSFSLPRPCGLFAYKCQIISRLDTKALDSGVFYIDTKTRIPSIVPIDSLPGEAKGDNYKKSCTKKYYYALQSRPLLLHKSKIVYTKDSAKRFYRSVVAMDGKGKVWLIVTLDIANLKRLAEFLLESDEKGGLGCVDALNLSGANSSGLIIRGRNLGSKTLVKRAKEMRVNKYFGNVNSAAATAIAVSEVGK